MNPNAITSGKRAARRASRWRAGAATHGDDAGDDRRPVALLGDLVVELDCGQGEDDGDQRDHAERAPHQGGDEHRRDQQPDGGRDRQVATRLGWRRRTWALTARPAGCPPRRRPVGAGGRRGMPDGSVPIVIRLGSRADIGLVDARSVLTAHRAVVGAALLAGSPVVGAWVRPVESSCQTGDSEVNDDHTSSSSSVAGPATWRRRRRRGRGAAPRRSAGRSSAAAIPVSLAPNVRPSSTASWSRVGLVLVEEWTSSSSSSRSRSPGVVRHRLSFPSPLLGHARTSSVPASGTQTSSSSLLLAAERLVDPLDVVVGDLLELLLGALELVGARSRPPSRRLRGACGRRGGCCGRRSGRPRPCA